MYRYGLLKKDENELDYILGVTVDRFLERRLQSRVLSAKLAKSMHHARTMVKDRHIGVNNQLVNVPSFLVTVENEASIRNHISSPAAQGRLSRRQKFKNKQSS